MLFNRTMPDSVVVPVLVYEDPGEAIDWLCDAFGFTVRWRVGETRAQLALGERGAILVGERRISPDTESGDATIFRPPRRGEVSHAILVRVEDVDGHYARARRGGARILRRLENMPHGERQYSAEDLEGHRWTFSQSIADVAPEDWGAMSEP